MIGFPTARYFGYSTSPFSNDFDGAVPRLVAVGFGSHSKNLFSYCDFPFLFERPDEALEVSCFVGLPCDHGLDVYTPCGILRAAVLATEGRNLPPFVDYGKVHPSKQLWTPAVVADFRATNPWPQTGFCNSCTGSASLTALPPVGSCSTSRFIFCSVVSTSTARFRSTKVNLIIRNRCSSGNIYNSTLAQIHSSLKRKLCRFAVAFC